LPRDRNRCKKARRKRKASAKKIIPGAGEALIIKDAEVEEE
jgi:hypothetical protein